jgi:hypothetical protein
MRDTKLILIDGLPGSGKTTTASWLASRLRSDSRTVDLFLEEHSDHPLHVGGALHPSGYNSGAIFFQRYTPASFVEESLERWRAFVAGALQSDAISVLDSYPFQSDVRVLLQLDAVPETIRDYARQVESIISPLHPVLVFFTHRDLLQAIENIEAITAQRGSRWSEYVVEMAAHSPYAIARGLHGFEGALALLAEYRKLTEELLHESNTPRIVLENCSGRWEECYRRMEEFLELT